MRDLHERMLAAVLGGDGLGGIAELAAQEAGGPVAILLPRHGLAAVWPERDLGDLPERVGPANGTLPEGVDTAVPVRAGAERVGTVVALAADRADGPVVDRDEVLRSAALATLTELAVIEARDQLAEELRGSFMEELRAGQLDGSEVVRRGMRLGCDLSGGAVAIASGAADGKPRYVAAIVTSGSSRAIAEPLEGRVLALVGVGPEGPEEAQASARRIVERIGAHGPAASSSYYADPADLGRGLEEAELVLDVVSRDARLGEQLDTGIGNGVYRLLFRALASNPTEVTRFYEDTVAPLVEHDRDYRTDLLETLEAYLANDCNMRATAEAVYAHRHTVAHRLTRIRELTGLDPASGEDRERLGLGIKAFHLIEPTLPR